MTEKNLVSRLGRGEKASFDELFNRYFEQCFTYAVSLLKDPDAAEDVVQNVFLKLWTGRERLDSSKPVKSCSAPSLLVAVNMTTTAIRALTLSGMNPSVGSVPNLSLTGNAVLCRNLRMKLRIS